MNKQTLKIHKTMINQVPNEYPRSKTYFADMEK